MFTINFCEWIKIDSTDANISYTSEAVAELGNNDFVMLPINRGLSCVCVYVCTHIYVLSHDYVIKWKDTHDTDSDMGLLDLFAGSIIMKML